MAVEVHILKPGVELLRTQYNTKKDAADALRVSLPTLNSWIRNHNGYKPGNDLRKVRVLVVGGKATTPTRKKRMTQETKPDYFKPVMFFWCVVACCLAMIAL